MDGVTIQSDLFEQQRPLVGGALGVIWGVGGEVEGLVRVAVLQEGDLDVGVGQGGGVGAGGLGVARPRCPRWPVGLCIVVVFVAVLG